MKRCEKNPLLTRADIPDIPPDLKDVTSVFNPGAVEFNNRTLLMLRVQSRGRRTFFLTAESEDGIDFRVSSDPVHFSGIENLKEPVYHAYDARISRLEGTYYIQFAMDMDSGCHLGLAQTDDFKTYEFLGITTREDSRNGVIFPEKVGGRYLRLERPNKSAIAGGQTTGSTICLSESENLLEWRDVAPVMSGRFHYWDEYIGSGPPPLKTRHGWLHLYHGVATHLASIFIYQAGVVLLDLKDPSRVLGRCPDNILEPREMYELVGQVPNVVFPSGWIADSVDPEGFARDDSPVRIYYGAADTSVCLAFTTVKELLEFSRSGL